jgi:hypothetical protein
MLCLPQIFFYKHKKSKEEETTKYAKKAFIYLVWNITETTERETELTLTHTFSFLR